MTIEFQKNLLRYFVQNRESRNYIEEVDSNLFDLQEHKFIFSAIQTYVKKFKYIPSEVNLVNFLTEAKKELRAKDTVMELMIETSKELYIPMTDDLQIYQTTIIEFVQRKKFKNFIDKNLDKLNSADSETFKSWQREVQLISNLSDTQNSSENSDGSFLLSDYSQTGFVNLNQPTPIFLNLINRMTADRGFYAPQLIVLMSGPKGFKTGTIINIVKGLLLSGKKIFWADFENGVNSIKNRVYQCMLECNKEDLYTDETQQLLQKMVQGFQKIGGDLRVEYFPAYLATLDDVDNKLDELKEKYNWEPDCIIYDYLDLAACSDPSVKENRFKLQRNYHHAIRINNKRNVFSITLSQISKEGVKKMKKDRYIDMQDFAEDFAKAMNCHAAFAMCRSDADVENNMGYIIPIVQREGLRYKPGIQCPVYIDESRQLMIEDEDYLEKFELAVKGKLKDNDN